ncbi:MAG: hypothetical protein ABSC54_10025 [Smithellaceae bacterium]|jgi:hypothetical protein
MTERICKSLAEQIADRCVYFNGIQNDKCEAGVIYPTPCDLLPCNKGRRQDEPLPDCEKRRFPTEEEVKKEVEESDRNFENMRKAFLLVTKIKKEQRGKNWQGVEVCPVCGGKLHLTHAAFNGHVWGKCEIQHCLSWME